MSKIEEILEIGPNSDSQALFENDCELYFSVPETDAIIKRVSLPESMALEPRQTALFEFSATLIDPPDSYYMDVYDLNGDTEKLTVGYNRNCVDEKIGDLTDRFIKPSGFRLRSLALADGYRYFCQPEGGELICLLDISETIGSYCFLWDNYPTHPGLLYNGRNSLSNEINKDSRFAIDLAATLQFQQATLFSSGRSVPLSRILVTGSAVEDALMDQIESLMNVTTTYPSMKNSAFSPEAINDAGRYLVGLGLTADI